MADKSQLAALNNHIMKLLAEKAGILAMQRLRIEIGKKADESEVQELSSKKADKSQVMAMNYTLNNKASNSDLQTVRVSIDKKSESQLAALNKYIRELLAEKVGSAVQTLQ